MLSISKVLSKNAFTHIVTSFYKASLTSCLLTFNDEVGAAREDLAAEGHGPTRVHALVSLRQTIHVVGGATVYAAADFVTSQQISVFEPAQYHMSYTLLLLLVFSIKN